MFFFMENIYPDDEGEGSIVVRRNGLVVKMVIGVETVRDEI